MLLVVQPHHHTNRALACLQGHSISTSQEPLKVGTCSSYADFDAYDIDLCSEESSRSSRAGSLHPVPSLPGLTEPSARCARAPGSTAAGCNGNVRLTKIQISNSNLSPTQHQAWRHGHTMHGFQANFGELPQAAQADPE